MQSISLDKTPCLRILLAFGIGILLSPYDKHHSLSILAIGCGALLYTIVLLKPRLFEALELHKLCTLHKYLIHLALSLCLAGIGAGYTQLRAHEQRQATRTTATQEKLSQSLSQAPNLSTPVQTLLSGICLGYMPKDKQISELRHDFSLSGAAHILAVSGFHLGVIIFAISLLIRWLHLPPPLYRISLIISAWAFTALVGFNIPTMRATIMLTLFILAKLLDRERYTPNILAASLLLQLIIDPYDIYRWGMWLSYTAVISIYLFYTPLKHSIGYIRQPILRHLWEVLTLSLAAQVLTLPLCLYLFGFISWSFIFTAIPFTLLSTLLIPLGLIAFLLANAGIALPPLSLGIETLGNMMITLSKWAASLDTLVLRVDFPLWALLSLWGIGLFVYYRLPSKRYTTS